MYSFFSVKLINKSCLSSALFFFLRISPVSNFKGNVEFHSQLNHQPFIIIKHYRFKFTTLLLARIKKDGKQNKVSFEIQPALLRRRDILLCTTTTIWFQTKNSFFMTGVSRLFKQIGWFFFPLTLFQNPSSSFLINLTAF